MRFFVFLLLTALSGISIASPAHAGWEKVFSEEFDGPSLDHDKWFTRYIYNDDTLDKLNDEKEVYRDNDNHLFKDGHLQLTARAIGNEAYESGMIRSKSVFLYGYYEARVKFPSGKGVWPAFWLNSDYDDGGKLQWPPEIDIFEFVNNAKDDTVHMAHMGTVGGDKTDQLLYANPKFNTHWSDYVSDTDLTADWHVWGLMWLPDSVTVYMDGIKLWSKTYRWVRGDGSVAPPAHVLLNLAIGGQWAGRYGIDNDAFPQSFDVDYVRVYQYFPNKVGGLMSLPQMPDLASYSYVPADSVHYPHIHPLKCPSLAKPTQVVSCAYNVTDIAAGRSLQLMFSLNDPKTGKSVFEQNVNLPEKYTGAGLTGKISVMLPDNLDAVTYDINVALIDHAVEQSTTKGRIPLIPVEGVVRETDASYRVGTITMTASGH